MLGVCYYPEHWPQSLWADDALRMKAMGITYVRIAEFAWSRIEPKRDEFDFEWLDKAIETLGEAGLKIVLCTPTATPPKWLMDELPDIAPVDENGQVRGFGSRRHYSFSSPVWLKETARICNVIASRYGHNPHVAAWQTDNEYGCHNTVLSWGANDLKAFQNWLRRRYQSPSELNDAWGNVFWSMDVADFNAIALPNHTVTEANPAARLDFWRFSSEQVADYNRLQCEIIRRQSPGRPITHNFMGLFHDFDHFKVADDLDFASWDSYPIGFTEQFPFTDEEKLRWHDTGHPDMAAFHHDLYRGCGPHRRWWVMEQQPGPVNWAPWNPVPRPGQIRLFTWEALAHGAECVSYFRWRQAPFAQEQMHAGLNLPNNAGLSVGGEEAARVGAELRSLGTLPKSTPAKTALVFDYEASWMLRIQPHGQDFSYAELTFRWYEAARRLGLDIDIVPPGRDLSGYSLVLAPSLPHVSETALAAFKRTDAVMLFGPRSGSKTRNFAIPEGLPPGPLQDMIPIIVRQVSSFRPNLSQRVSGAGIAGKAIRWREEVSCGPGVQTLATYEDGSTALAQMGGVFYIGCGADAALLGSVIGIVAQVARLPMILLPAHVRLRRRDAMTFALNYGPEPWVVPDPDTKTFILGQTPLGPQDIAIWL